MSEACRHQGIFLHHVTQWKQDMINNRNVPADPQKQVTVKPLRDEIKALNKDLRYWFCKKSQRNPGSDAES